VSLPWLTPSVYRHRRVSIRTTTHLVTYGTTFVSDLSLLEIKWPPFVKAAWNAAVLRHIAIKTLQGREQGHHGYGSSVIMTNFTSAMPTPIVAC